MIAVTIRRGTLLVVSNMLLRIGASAMIGSAFSTAGNGTDTSLSARNPTAAAASRRAPPAPPPPPPPPHGPPDHPDQRVGAAGQRGLPHVHPLLDQLAPDRRRRRHDERRDAAQRDGQLPQHDHGDAHDDRRQDRPCPPHGAAARAWAPPRSARRTSVTA